MRAHGFSIEIPWVHRWELTYFKRKNYLLLIGYAPISLFKVIKTKRFDAGKESHCMT
jgi:hypothetical protein